MLMASDLKLRELPERVYWIYALVDPRNDEIRYVGQSLEVHSRGQYHKRSMEQPVKGLWIQELRQVGLEPRGQPTVSALCYCLRQRSAR